MSSAVSEIEDISQMRDTGSIISTCGILSLLEEDDQEIQYYALKRLDELVESHWHEIADYTHVLETLLENKSFPYYLQCSYLLSKIFFQLGLMDKAMEYALASTYLLNMKESSTFMQAMTTHCIDAYIKQRKMLYDDKRTDMMIDPRLEEIFVDFIERAMEEQMMKEAFGLTLEARRLDLMEDVIINSRCLNDVASYYIDMLSPSVENVFFRYEIFEKLVDCACRQWRPDFSIIFRCLTHVQDSHLLSSILLYLIRGNSHSYHLALQTSIDLFLNSTQGFVNEIYSRLKQFIAGELTNLSLRRASKKRKSDAATHINSQIQHESEQEEESALSEEYEAELQQPLASKATFERRLSILIEILEGKAILRLQLKFLVEKMKSDISILGYMKDNNLHTILRSAVVISNALINCGTTCDVFLRTNLEWINTSPRWNSFLSIASLGVIHRGHLDRGFNVIEPYIQNAANDPKRASGAVLAFGLICAGYGVENVPRLLELLPKSTEQTYLHGCCLAIGLAAMGTGLNEVIDQMKTFFFGEDCVTGFAAALSLGLISAGTRNDDVTTFMFQLIKSSPHLFVQRGVALGLAMSVYGEMRKADTLLENLINDVDPIVRICGAYSFASAYVGTCSDYAVKTLWKLAINDACDDVKRTAVSCFGFILYSSPEVLMSIMCLFVDSYNPNIRCGVAYALGVAFAGTSNVTALKMVEKLMDDLHGYVKQYAYIAAAMICIQHNENTSSKVKEMRAKFYECSIRRNEDYLSRFGAIVASGLIDAGGRNQTISLVGPNGQPRMIAVIGLMAFHHLWYWYPLSLFICLSFTPSCIIGVDHKLQTPDLEFIAYEDKKFFAQPESYKPIHSGSRERHRSILSAATRESIRNHIFYQTKETRHQTYHRNAEKMKNKHENLFGSTLTSSMLGSSQQHDSRTLSPLKQQSKLDSSTENVGTITNSETETDVDTETTASTLFSNVCRIVPHLSHLIQLNSQNYKPVVPLTRGGIIVFEKLDADNEDTLATAESKNAESQNSSASSSLPPASAVAEEEQKIEQTSVPEANNQ